MTRGGRDPAARIAADYRRWAREAHGLSPEYEALAQALAAEPVVLAFLGGLPPVKRQPDLLFAGARYLLGVPPGISELGALVRDDQSALAGVMLARRTHTNEPARCATLLPALAQLPGPLALIEVGASAGLTLLVAPRDRERFAATVRELPAVGLSNEAPGVVPGVPVPAAYAGPGPARSCSAATARRRSPSPKGTAAGCSGSEAPPDAARRAWLRSAFVAARTQELFDERVMPLLPLVQ